MNLFVVLFAFLAVQGWTSARSISEADDDFSSDVMEFMHSSEFSYLDYFGDLPHETFHEFTGTAAHPEKCLPYIQDVYGWHQAFQLVIEVGGIVDKEHQLWQKFRDGMNNCLGQTSNQDKKTCFADLFKQTSTEGKPINDAYLKIKPKVIDIMDKFDKCLAGKTEKVNSHSQSNLEKCLPYVQGAYDTAVEVRRIVRQAHKLDRNFYEGSKKCSAESDPDTKKTCLEYLHEETAVKGMPIANAHSKISPKIFELMDKFYDCLYI